MTEVIERPYKLGHAFRRVQRSLIHPDPANPGIGNGRVMEHMECGHIRAVQPGDLNVNVRGARRVCEECARINTAYREKVQAGKVRNGE